MEPELASETFTLWCSPRGIEVRCIQPGKPDQNGFIEGFNRSYREEVLDARGFESVEDVQQLTDEWLRDDDEQRPHEALGRVPPATYMPRLPSPPESRNAVST